MGCSYRTVGDNKQVMFSDVFGTGKEWATPICASTSISVASTLAPSTVSTVDPALNVSLNSTASVNVDSVSDPYEGSVAGLCPEDDIIATWEECMHAMTILFGEDAYISTANLAEPGNNLSSWFDGIPMGCSYRIVGENKQVMFSDVFGSGKQWAIPICANKFLTTNPSLTPTLKPSFNPTTNPSSYPTLKPSFNPTLNPSFNPTLNP